MEPNKIEYTALRTELIHHDSSCLSILGLLLASSTAIYGLVANQNTFPLLLLLSIIWLIGFLYIVEKRASIRRIAFYIQTCIELSDSTFQWETWSRHSRTNLSLPTVSPLKIEFALLLIVNSVNTVWLWAEGNIWLAVGATTLLLTSLVWSSLIIKKYYAFSRHNYVK